MSRIKKYQNCKSGALSERNRLKLQKGISTAYASKHDEITKLASGSKLHTETRQVQEAAKYHNLVMEQHLRFNKDISGAARTAKAIGNALSYINIMLNDVRVHLQSRHTITSTPTQADDPEVTTSAVPDQSEREEWSKNLSTLLYKIYVYAFAQRLDNYRLLHRVLGETNEQTSSTSVARCCPLKYAPRFTYSSPVGKCLISHTSVVNNLTEKQVLNINVRNNLPDEIEVVQVKTIQNSRMPG